MIKITGLAAGYDGRIVIPEINLNMEAGKITTILGPNGSGKSTLMKCLARQLPLMGGTIMVANRPIQAYAPKEYAQRVSYLKQSRDVPHISVESLVLHGRFPYMTFPRKYTSHDKQLAQKSMEHMGIWNLRHKELGELSGGERQKVYLAMVLAQDTDVLLLDEPGTYLDIRYQMELLELLTGLRDEGKTIVAIFHDISSALQIADAVCVMDKGEVAYLGAPSPLIRSSVIGHVFGVTPVAVSLDGTEFVAFPVKKKDA